MTESIFYEVEDPILNNLGVKYIEIWETGFSQHFRIALVDSGRLNMCQVSIMSPYCPDIKCLKESGS
jgi:hypothetical protein